MDYKKLSVEIWKQLDLSGSLIAGYKSIWLSKDENRNSFIHIFKDESGKFHLAIECGGINKEEIEDPGINGLQVNLSQYRIDEKNIARFIDVRCNMPGYLEEFTEVTKEISRIILEEGVAPSEAVNRVIRNWKTFWANQNKQLLSDDQQIGLICELKILKHLCLINPATALNCWKGPKGEVHDFIFSDWSMEVKGTAKKGTVHTINGIDQLRPINKKSLALISLLVSVSDAINSVNLQSAIEEIIEIIPPGRNDLLLLFNTLLSQAGYSPIYAEEYKKYSLDILETKLFIVDGSFPRLTCENLNEPLNGRITNIRYDISLAGLEGIENDKINWGNYFY